MDPIRLRALAGLAAACAASTWAQQPVPPSFAEPNLTPKGVAAMAANCAACHGTSGRAAPGSALPSLAGRPREEIVRAMAEFREGKRPATLMHQVAKGFSEAETAAIAEHFARLPR